MYENIFHIREIRDNNHGEDRVNELLESGWILLSICQVASSECQDIVYIVGASKEVYDSSCKCSAENKDSKFSEFLSQGNRNL